MKNKEQFDKTVSVLVKAYMDGTLNADRCSACAVGNILGHGDWTGNSRHKIGELSGGARNEVYIFRYANDNSGYTLKELCDIEKAFLLAVDYPVEECGSCEITDSGNFKGLMAVIDVLQEIHQCNKKEVKEAKLKFVK